MRTIISISLLLISFTVFSQNKSIPAIDKSGLDMSYYPANYPILKIQGKVDMPLVMRLIYSRPLKNERDVFGGLVEYGSIWRLGANESTEIEFFRDVKINNVKIKKGRYTLYAIPTADKWTVIVNRDTDSWGAFKYDAKKDVVRADIKTEKNSEPTEAFSMFFEKSAKGANLVMMWDDIKSSLSIEF